ncbi:MAG TPA: hypothetical protein VJV79_35575, partial [Polyangiaceae bacterium]|nr:hypothetical protein [Polyangiaceae bacterium]
GELLAVGLQVEIIERRPTQENGSSDSRAWRESMANERGFVAIIDVLGEVVPTSVEIWIFQQAPRRSERLQVVLDPGAARSSETLAIRAIEALRSSFLELDLSVGNQPGSSEARSQPQAPAPLASEPAQATRTPVERFGLEAGATLLTSLDGVGPAFLPLLRFDWRARPALLMQATLSGFGTQPSLESAAGSARVAQQFGLLGALYDPPSASGLRPLFGLFAGVLRTSLDGQADSPEHGHQVAQWSFLLEGSVGARLSLSHRYYLTLASHVQLAAPYVAIHFADTLVATTGRPNVLLSLTVGAWL